MGFRPRTRPTKIDAALAVLAPTLGLLTFPHRVGRPQNPVYLYLGQALPRYDLKSLPTDCMGYPYGPAGEVRFEFLIDLAADFSVFTFAMFGMGFLATTLTSVRLVRASQPPLLTLWTLLGCVLSVLAWAELWRFGLAAMT
jgi:hypothetical protein